MSHFAYDVQIENVNLDDDSDVMAQRPSLFVGVVQMQSQMDEQTAELKITHKCVIFKLDSVIMKCNYSMVQILTHKKNVLRLTNVNCLHIQETVYL